MRYFTPLTAGKLEALVGKRHVEGARALSIGAVPIPIQDGELLIITSRQAPRTDC